MKVEEKSQEEDFLDKPFFVEGGWTILNNTMILGIHWTERIFWDN
jgi:hypothetical protein